MEFRIKGKKVELKYTFNSIRYIEDLDLSLLEQLNTKPFKLVGIVQHLLLGAVNSDPKKKFTEDDVAIALEAYVKDGNSFIGLYEKLNSLLEESDFFKALQETEEADK